MKQKIVPLNCRQYVHQFITESITRIHLPLSSYVLILENNKKIIGFHAILCDVLRITCSKKVQISKLNIDKVHILKEKVNKTLDCDQKRPAAPLY